MALVMSLDSNTSSNVSLTLLTEFKTSEIEKSDILRNEMAPRLIYEFRCSFFLNGLVSQRCCPHHLSLCSHRTSSQLLNQYP